MRERTHKVRTPLFPTYSEVRVLMPILEGVPKGWVTSMLNAISGQTGTPQDPVDWSEPNRWINERLSGQDQELARKIWEESDHKVNPRHVYGSHMFINGYELLVPDASGVYQITPTGARFLDDDPETVTDIDDREGLMEIPRLA